MINAPADDGKHECPYKPCARRVSREYLACRAHWMKVSPPTRRRVYDTFQFGPHAAYLDARADAIEEMNSR